MKRGINLKKAIKTSAALAAFVLTAVMGAVLYFQTLPDSFYSRGGEVSIGAAVTVKTSAENLSDDKDKAASLTSVKSRAAKVYLFGIIPVKETRIVTVSEKSLVPCGTPFGIKLTSNGVMTVGLSDIQTQSGLKCPAKAAGIKKGDIITDINGQKVYTNEEIAEIVKNNKRVFVTYERDGQEKTAAVTPVRDLNGIRRIGLWVRDSTAGIGTMTFYDPASGAFGGLGHPICDVDTGQMIPVLTGEVVDVEISSVEKGQIGDPGELCGSFTSSEASGKITSNSASGMFGELYKSPSESEPLPIALKQEIKTGQAYILTTVEGTEPKKYSINIDSISLGDQNGKNMQITVTDKQLLDKTGGIVQGMSGSPIIQNGKIVGAVTHVLVNDPARGYGIFSELMYDSLK